MENMKLTRYKSPTSINKYDAIYVLTQGKSSVAFTVEELRVLYKFLRKHIKQDTYKEFSFEIINKSNPSQSIKNEI
jgi:hypothetical protein